MNFRGSLQSSRAKIENGANFFLLPFAKTVKDPLLGVMIFIQLLQKVYPAGLWIRAHFLRIRIQLLSQYGSVPHPALKTALRLLNLLQYREKKIYTLELVQMYTRFFFYSSLRP